MPHSNSAPLRDRLGDFTADSRLLMLAVMAVVVGVSGTLAARTLLKLIALFTNLAYYQQVSTVLRPFPVTLPLWTVVVPVIGDLIIGLMARDGSEKIRGHGIPRAIEAILIGQSRIAPKVASITHVIQNQNLSRRLNKSAPTTAILIKLSALALLVGLFYALAMQWTLKPVFIAVLAVFPIGAFGYVFFLNGRG